MDRLNELKFCNIGAKMTKVEVVSYVYKSIIALIGHKLYTTNQVCFLPNLLAVELILFCLLHRHRQSW